MAGDKGVVGGTGESVGWADYARAEQFLPWNVGRLLGTPQVTPRLAGRPTKSMARCQ